MAHAVAGEVWLPNQNESRKVAWEKICSVFGWAPSPWLRDLSKRLQVDNPQGSQAGNVVFHDAWPLTWPRLAVDIINNHHSQYYENDAPPGDWEDPIMVSFLTVEPGTQFEFGLSTRREENTQHKEDSLIELARQWLLGALCH